MRERAKISSSLAAAPREPSSPGPSARQVRSSRPFVASEKGRETWNRGWIRGNVASLASRRREDGSPLVSRR